jgi:hypothetical protein
MAMCLSGEGQIRTAKPRELHAWTRLDIAPCAAIIRMAHHGSSRPSHGYIASTFKSQAKRLDWAESTSH